MVRRARFPMTNVASWSIRGWVLAPAAKPVTFSSSACHAVDSVSSLGRARVERHKSGLVQPCGARILSKILSLTAMIAIVSTLSGSRTLRAAEDLNKIHALATKEWARESIEYNIKRLEYLLPFQERWGSAERIAELIRQGGATSDVISDDQIDSLAASAEK